MLTNETTHTIAGSGQLGYGSLSIVNHGLIDANHPINVNQTNALTVNPGYSGTVTNTGTMQASNGGYLRYGLYGRYGSYGRYGRYGGDYYGNYKYYSDKT